MIDLSKNFSSNLNNEFLLDLVGNLIESGKKKLIYGNLIIAGYYRETVFKKPRINLKLVRIFIEVEEFSRYGRSKPDTVNITFLKTNGKPLFASPISIRYAEKIGSDYYNVHVDSNAVSKARDYNIIIASSDMIDNCKDFYNEIIKGYLNEILDYKQKLEQLFLD